MRDAGWNSDGCSCDQEEEFLKEMHACYDSNNFISSIEAAQGKRCALEHPLNENIQHHHHHH